MNWWNRFSTRASLLRSETLALAALVGLMCVGLLLSTLKGVIEKESLLSRLDEEAFVGTEADSVIARELAAFEAQKTDSLPKPKLNFNEATEAELLALPDIGATLADRLVRFRKFKGGRLKSMDELLEVKGVTPERLKRLKEHLETR